MNWWPFVVGFWKRERTYSHPRFLAWVKRVVGVPPKREAAADMQLGRTSGEGVRLQTGDCPPLLLETQPCYCGQKPFTLSLLWQVPW